MSKSVKSARGEDVNFDLLKIKQQIASAPKPTVVKAREDFVDQKYKRRLKKAVRSVADTVATGSPVDIEAVSEAETEST